MSHSPSRRLRRSPDLVVRVSCAPTPLSPLNRLLGRRSWTRIEIVLDVRPEDDIEAADLDRLDDAKRRLRHLARLDSDREATDRARAWIATRRVLGDLMDGGWRVYAGEDVRRAVLAVVIRRAEAEGGAFTLDIPWEADPDLRACRAVDDLSGCWPDEPC